MAAQAKLLQAETDERKALIEEIASLKQETAELEAKAEKAAADAEYAKVLRELNDLRKETVIIEECTKVLKAVQTTIDSHVLVQSVDLDEG
jgi:hypothetical protein